MATGQVPVLELDRFGSDFSKLAKEAGQAYREFGFCGFINHGIPDQVIDDAYRVFSQFYSLPERTKFLYLSKSGGQRGYTPMGIEQARDQSIPDLKEFWHVGREMEANNPWPGILAPNHWPVEIPGFKDKAYALYQALDALGIRILQLIAASLGLAPDWFDKHVAQGNSILRAIHYPPILDKQTPAVRAAQHEDINLITLLIGSNEAGLQILSQDGAWIPVTSIPGTIVVNIGDMMQRLTNHVLPSTPHRVVNPPGLKADASRYSIPFFLHPNPDFLIKTLPECISETRPNLYPQPITANEFLIERLREIKLL